MGIFMGKNNFWKRLAAVVTGVMMAAALVISPIPGNALKAEAAISGSDFLKASGKVLRNNYGNGNVVNLRGTNAGGYLVQEFWMTPTDYSSGVNCEMDIYRTLTNRFGESRMRELIKTYQDNYWTTQDFENCKNLGINCIRLPFWYMNFVDFNGNYLSGCFDRIDWFVEQAGQRGMYVILDFHGAPGSQNGSDHSGIDGGDNKQGASEFFFGNNA
ncbi:MAG: cellulase family glycosylhydrolase, partial [Acetatifactor sp.]|nr:cellulase family glycosylhydrolase [Acetatifactor sp.]